MNYYTILSNLYQLSDKELEELNRAIIREQSARFRRGQMVQLNLVEEEEGQTDMVNELIRSR